MDDLRGSRVLITGASTGIGEAVARAFAARGASLALHYNRSEAQAKALADSIAASGGQAVLVHGDLNERGAAKRVVEAAAEQLGGLDVLINNAGSLIKRTPFADVDDALIDAVFDLNVRSVIAATQAAIPYLERQGGAIINVGSIAGADGGGPGAAVYASSKAFIHNLTKHLARDLAAKGIRVNTVSPGVIATPFHAATPAERMEAMRKSVPLGRIGTAEECVGAFLFLASPSLSGYITGQNIHVNGGQFLH
ncbi:MAG: glucose 1-dehydrogenase [Hyphomicrobiales bacterium]|nr:glucose 1-dehydrogenase [Hyphomicrobiales bacterium]